MFAQQLGYPLNLIQTVISPSHCSSKVSIWLELENFAVKTIQIQLREQNKMFSRWILVLHFLQPGVKSRSWEHTSQIHLDRTDKGGPFPFFVCFCLTSKHGFNQSFIMSNFFHLVCKLYPLFYFDFSQNPHKTTGLSLEKRSCGANLLKGTGDSITPPINLLHSWSWPIIGPSLKLLQSDAYLRVTCIFYTGFWSPFSWSDF